METVSATWSFSPDDLQLKNFHARELRKPEFRGVRKTKTRKTKARKTGSRMR